MAVGFFPLGVGDTWQYHKFYVKPYPVEHFSNYYVVRVDRDSLRPNGKHYLHLVGMADACPVGTGFFRADTASASIYRYVDVPTPGEQLQDSLRAGIGDYVWGFSCPRIYQRQDTISFLGVRTAQKEYSVGWTPPSPEWNLAHGFGLVRRTEVAGDYPVEYLITDELIYAKIDGVEYGEMVGLSPGTPTVPSRVHLAQNYPNPFNPTTTIRFSVPVREIVELTVLNILGQAVVTLARGEREAGQHTVTFDGSDLAAGVYLYRLRAGGTSVTKKLMIVK